LLSAARDCSLPRLGSGESRRTRKRREDASARIYGDPVLRGARGGWPSGPRLLAGAADSPVVGRACPHSVQSLFLPESGLLARRRLDHSVAPCCEPAPPSTSRATGMWGEPDSVPAAIRGAAPRAGRDPVGITRTRAPAPARLPPRRLEPGLPGHSRVRGVFFVRARRVRAGLEKKPGFRERPEPFSGYFPPVGWATAG